MSPKPKSVMNLFEVTRLLPFDRERFSLLCVVVVILCGWKALLSSKGGGWSVFSDRYLDVYLGKWSARFFLRVRPVSETCLVCVHGATNRAALRGGLSSIVCVHVISDVATLLGGVLSEWKKNRRSLDSRATIIITTCAWRT